MVIAYRAYGTMRSNTEQQEVRACEKGNLNERDHVNSAKKQHEYVKGARGRGGVKIRVS